MAKYTNEYEGEWSRAGLSVSPIMVKKRRHSPERLRSASSSSYSRHHVPPYVAMRSTSSPIRPRKLFEHDPQEDPSDVSYDFDTSEDSVYFNDSPMRQHWTRRGITMSRNAPYEPSYEKKMRKKDEKMGYLRLAVNVSIACLAMYAAIKLLLTINGDLNIKIKRAQLDVAAEIAACKRQWEVNHCQFNSGPAIAKVCSEWEACMERDPFDIGYVHTTASTLGEIIEGLIGSLDLRSMAVILALVAAVVYFR